MEIFKLFGSIFVDTNKAQDSLHKVSNTAGTVGNAFSKIGGLLKKLGGIMGVAFTTTAIISYGKKCVATYKDLALAETKLKTIMKERLNASDSEIKSVEKLATAQSKSGVIGKSVQLAGAQQVATYLKQGSSINKLLPSMNDLLAQQKGVNATQGDATNIANLFGKAMMGQTGALKRVGISFSDSQAKVLKYGTESEKVAMLSTVITENVGHMNKSIAKTDAGKIKQAQMRFGGLQSTIGKALLPVVAKVMDKFGKFALVLSTKVVPAIQNFGKFLAQHKTTITVVASILTGLVAGFVALKIAMGMQAIIASVTTSYSLLIVVLNFIRAKAYFAAVSFKALGASMLANPVGLVIAGIVALVVAFTLLWKKCAGFRNFWKSIWKGIKTVFSNTATNIKNKVNEIGAKFTAFKTKLGVVINWIKTHFKLIIGFIVNPFGTAFVQLYKHNAKFRAKVNQFVQGIKNLFKNGFEAIKGFITHPFQSVFSGLSNIFGKIRKAVTSLFSGLHIKTPHFVWKGGSWKDALKKVLTGNIKDVGLGVDWYAKGGIMTKPTAFGMSGNSLMVGGEAGAEAIAPISTLMNYVQQAVDNSNGSNTDVLNAIYSELHYLNNNFEPKMVKILTESVKCKFGQREIMRLVKA